MRSVSIWRHFWHTLSERNLACNIVVRGYVQSSNAGNGGLRSVV